jgi:hypothetical protein
MEQAAISPTLGASMTASRRQRGSSYDVFKPTPILRMLGSPIAFCGALLALASLAATAFALSEKSGLAR